MGTNYDVLGLTPAATEEEIDAAYRALAKVVHPDVGGDCVMFQVLQEADEVVGDPVQRAAYDRALHAAAPYAAVGEEAARREAAQREAARHETALREAVLLDLLRRGVEELDEGESFVPSAPVGGRWFGPSTPAQRAEGARLAEHGIGSIHQTDEQRRQVRRTGLTHQLVGAAATAAFLLLAWLITR